MEEAVVAAATIKRSNVKTKWFDYECRNEMKKRKRSKILYTSKDEDKQEYEEQGDNKESIQAKTEGIERIKKLLSVCEKK